MATVEDAIRIAADAHRGQVDKAGQPYILHPLRVMARFLDPELQIVAVLHDVVEDTPWTLSMLRAQGFSGRVLDALSRLTRWKTETYGQFIERAAAHSLARAVKLADLEDNLDVRRLPPDAPTEQDLERLRRYRRAWARLTLASR